MIRNSACIILLLAIAILVDLIASTVASVAEHSHGRAWRHRHRLRHGRSPRRHKPNLGSQLPFPTPTTPVDFQFTASHYNLSVYENSIDQRAVAADPSNPQMVGVWLPRGYNQIQFKIIEGDPQDRFGVSAKRIGNFAFLQLEPKGQMDVLNRELQPEFLFTIRATVKRKRGLALEATATVHLRVLDENDNPPMFKELNYHVQIDDPYLAVNSRLVQLEAFDADEGLNGALYYSLVKPSQYFYIEPRSGWIRTFAPLDALKKPTNFSLEVRIEDRASRLYFHQKQQENDDSGQQILPIFNIRNRATVNVLLTESIDAKHKQRSKLNLRQLQFNPFSVPVKVALLELDTTEKEAQNIQLDLSRLNAEAIWNCAKLERLNSTQFALWLCPTALMPKNEDFELEIVLTVRIGTSRIVDNLSGKRLTYGDQEYHLKIDPSVGYKIWLDSTTTNDGPLLICVNESTSSGAMIWNFRAGINHPTPTLRKKIRSIYYLNFSVSESGRVTLAQGKSLDFEEATKFGGRQNGPAIVVEFGVDIHEIDEQRPHQKGQCRVQLVVLDVNDNAPVFERDVYEATVLENAPAGTEIVQVKAADTDSQHFGRISYSLISAQLIPLNQTGSNSIVFDGFNLEQESDSILTNFTLGEEDGRLRVKEPLDFEAISKDSGDMVVQVRVRARDGCEPSSSADALINVKVLDQNDNAPAIMECNKLMAVVQEGNDPGHTVLPLSVTDADSKEFSGPFRFHLTGTNSDAFAVDPLHNLITTRQLHFAERQDYQLKVQVEDSGGLSSPECPLRIRVQPQSRHAPEVQPLHIQLIALHGEFLGGPLEVCFKMTNEGQFSMETSDKWEESDAQQKQQLSPLLPKESDQMARKRPLAIQELLEKKKARLANGTGTTEENSKATMCNDQQQNGVDNGLAQLVEHLCNGERDNETSTSSSNSGGMDNEDVPMSLGHLLKRAIAIHSLPAGQLIPHQQNDKMEDSMNFEYGSPLKAHNKASNGIMTLTPNKFTVEINECISKSVPQNRIFAQVPGRLSLLSNVVKYKMTVAEVRRRLMGPECFNFSLLGALLRRAKMPEKSQMLVEELSQVGLNIPRGRRRVTQVTLLSALTEQESIQFANDFKKIAESEFPAKQMAIELLSMENHKDGESRSADEIELFQSRLQKLTSTLHFIDEFMLLLESDRSEIMEKSDEPILSEKLQNGFSTFSMLSHGFGNPAISVGVWCFTQFLKNQIEIIKDIIAGKRQKP